MVDPDILRYIRLLRPIPSRTLPEGRLVGPIRVFLFDIYGTLFISGCGDIGVAEANPSPTPALTAMLGDFRVDCAPMDLTRRLHRHIREEHRRKRADGIPCPEINIISIWQTMLDWPDDRHRQKNTDRKSTRLNSSH